MTHMRHFATAAAVVALLGWAVPAAAQTIIGDTGAPSVEVNLDVLQSLSSEPASTAQPAAPASSGSGSVLLIAPQSGGSSAATTGTTGGSVPLLDQPATTPAQTGSIFVFPEIPATKPAVPEPTVQNTAVATTGTTTTTLVSAPEPEPDAELEPVVIVTEPEPSALVVTESELQAQPAVTTAATVAQTDDGADALGDDPFAQLDDMLDEPVAPEDIEGPEPDMEIDAEQAVAMPATEQVTPDGLDLRILFEPGSDAMTDQDRTLLKQLADRLTSDQNQRIQLRAYASSADGTDSAARRLALSRALQVRAYLIENNVRSTRIDVRALGDKVEGEGPLDRIDIVLVES